GELARERAGHDMVAGFQPPAVGHELARQPGDRPQRMAEHRIASPGAHLGAVDAHANRDARQIERLGETHPRSEHEELLLGVVGQCELELAREVAARLDDLQRWMTAIDRAGDVVDPERGALEITAQHDTDLVFEARRDQVVVAEPIAAFDASLAQEASEDRLVHLELILDRLGGEADLPACMRHAGGAAAAHERQLDAVGVVEVQPIAPLGRKIDASRSRGPELLDRLLQRTLVETHAVTSGGSSTMRFASRARPTTLPILGAAASRVLSIVPDPSATSTSYSRPWYSTRRTVPRTTPAACASSARLRSSGRMAASTSPPSPTFTRPRTRSPPPSAVTSSSAPRATTVSGIRLR